MKQVLIIDEAPLLREYLKSKLSEQGIAVTVAINGLDGISKTRTVMPDLIILDYHLTRISTLEVLKEIKQNPNTAKIPIIITAQKMDQKKIIELVSYNVKKVFTKPVKIDALLETISEMLDVPIDIDNTPSIVEAHVNDDVLFIEIAEGLNREKLELLRYKISELIALYEIRVPKVILLLSNMKLSYADMPNLEKLFEVILSASRAPQRYIRVLTNDEFTRRFIEGRKDLANIEVSKDLFSALEGLLSEFTGEYELGEKKIELAGERVLQAEAGPEGEAVHLKFQTEKKRALTSIEESRDFLQGLKIAVVDDDPVIQQLIKTTFEKGGAAVYPYSDGQEFIEALKKETFDLIFLDLLMPRIDGFGVLQRLKSADLGIPVIVLSAVSQRNTVIKAFQAGSKSYLIKPLKPLDIITKTLEILRPGV